MGNVPDLMSEVKLFEWAGVGFGEVETYRIMKSLKVIDKYNKCVLETVIRKWSR